MKLSVKAGLGLAALLAAGLVADAATEHDNLVNFDITGIKRFEFKTTGHSVTAGQPFGGATTKIRVVYQSAQMNVRAGRKGSGSVADWFRTQVGSGAAVSGKTSDAFPKSLNFALEGTLSMLVDGKTTKCDKILFAQGKHGGYHDWWIGGPGLKRTNMGRTLIQTCNADGGAATVLVEPVCHSGYCNSFKLSINPI